MDLNLTNVAEIISGRCGEFDRKIEESHVARLRKVGGQLEDALTIIGVPAPLAKTVEPVFTSFGICMSLDHFKELAVASWRDLEPHVDRVLCQWRNSGSTGLSPAANDNPNPRE